MNEKIPNILPEKTYIYLSCEALFKDISNNRYLQFLKQFLTKNLYRIDGRNTAFKCAKSYC